MKQHSPLKGMLELIAVIGVSVGLGAVLQKLGWAKPPAETPTKTSAEPVLKASTTDAPPAHTDNISTSLRPGWNRPLPATLPAPTYWPMVVSIGIVFVAWGVLASWIISVAGGLMFLIGLIGWIGALRHDP